MITFEQAEQVFYELAFNNKTYEELSKQFNIHKTTLCRWMKNFKNSFNLNDSDTYSKKSWLKYKHQADIIKKYQEGLSTVQIAEEYGVADNHLIANLLRELNVEIRPRGYQSKTNQTLFQDISSEIEAYTLGLITADGSVSANYSITITLHEDDKYLLEEINKQLCDNTGTITKIKDRATYRLIFNGKQICSNLEKYNIVPNKSHIMTSIYIFQNTELMRHYMRGLFDGDGVCSKNNQYLRLGYCAHVKSFTESYQNFLCQTLQLSKNQLFDTGGSWNCSWGAKSDVQKIYKYLYKDATIFLQRKKDKIQNYLYGNTEVTI